MAAKRETLIDPATVAKLLPKKDNVVGKVKVKKPPAKPKAEPEGPQSPKSPLLNNIDVQLRATFDSGRPMEDPVNLIQCKHCKKPMLRSVAYSHIKICLQKKNERAQKKKEQKEANRKAREAREKEQKAEKIAQEADSEEESGADKPGGAKKSAVKSATGKKRKAEDGNDKNPKKKTKKEIEAAKPKQPKPKGPVDVEKQCGVLLPNGAQCARSLTCKSHAMGAKRAVPGRSLPYDHLLAAYQKKNQAKQQKAAMDANAPLIDDIAENQGPVDSDEEKDQVMAAIARSRPQPIAQHFFIPLRQRYQTMRIKDMLSNALGNRSTTGPFSGSAAASAAAVASSSAAEGADAESRRSSIAQPTSARGPGPGGLPTPTGRKPSATSTVSATPVAT